MMRKRHITVVHQLPLVLCALVIALAVVVLASPPSFAEPGGRPLTATLTGAAEAPGPGDPDGSGLAHLRLNQGQETICFELTVSNIMLPATGAHIHKAPVGVAGPVVVPLTPPDSSGSSSGCVSVPAELIKDIRQHPEAYYVNVHTTAHPAGAVRGQLSK